ncbi:MAG: hypothetical protein KBH06_06920 [Spirochaetes bacterium]|nr:hypothetical protein [Spirochaetota bacterium]
MIKEIVQRIENEISMLYDTNYRREEKVWANEKQIKHIEKLWNRAKNLKSDEIKVLSRYVLDVCSLDSKLSKNISELYQIIVLRGIEG